MKKIVCELCGSSNLTKNGDHFVCNDCNTSYSLEEAKNLLKEVEENPQDDKELENLYELARRARREDNNINAERFYSQIALKRPYDWEANYFQVFYQVSICKIGEIGIQHNKLKGALITAFELIDKYVVFQDDKLNACREIIATSMPVILGHFRSARNWHSDTWGGLNSSFTQDMLNYTYSCIINAYLIGDEIERLFVQKIPLLKTDLVNVYMDAIKMHEEILPYFADKQLHTNQISVHRNKIHQYQGNVGYTYTNQANLKNNSGEKNDMAIPALICSFLFPLIGLILAIIGLNKAKKLNGEGEKNCKIALGISIAFMVGSLLLSIIEIIASLSMYLY